MSNPFEIIEARLSCIENLILDLKHQPKQDNTANNDEVLTIKQAGILLNLSVPTLYGYVSRSEIPVSKRGNRLYFSKVELLQWIKAGRKKSLSETAQEAESYLKKKGAKHV